MPEPINKFLTPKVINGRAFRYYGLTIVSNPQFRERDVGAQVVLNLYPYDYDEAGDIVRPMVEVDGQMVVDATPLCWVYGDAYAAAAADAAVAQAVGGVSVMVRNFVHAKLG